MNQLLRFYSILFFFMLIFVACEEDPCDSKNCDHGVCDTVSGDCLCSKGYQRDASEICTIEWTAKMVGNYTATDSCTGANPGSISYNSTVTAASEQVFTLSNFHNLGHSINLTHTNSVSFEINDTSLSGQFLSGSGILQDTVIVLDYIFGDTLTNNIDTCRATFR